MKKIQKIIWNIDKIPKKYQWIVKLNPMSYIVNGCRDSLIYKFPFWKRPIDSLYFGRFTILVFLFSIRIFEKFKPHFGEVV